MVVIHRKNTNAAIVKFMTPKIAKLASNVGMRVNSGVIAAVISKLQTKGTGARASWLSSVSQSSHKKPAILNSVLDKKIVNVNHEVCNSQVTEYCDNPDSLFCYSQSLGFYFLLTSRTSSNQFIAEF